jgi:hypothetical protein
VRHCQAECGKRESNPSDAGWLELSGSMWPKEMHRQLYFCTLKCLNVWIKVKEQGYR